MTVKLQHFPIATLEPNLSNDSEVVVVDQPPATVAPETVSVTEQTEDDKDERIADLETQLEQTNRMLSEQVRRDTNKTDITINVERANVRKENNPLVRAFRKMRREG
ncbi:MAG: hypothetical protein JO170_17815 [Verrucomicrobia bacterium]|nr:hypothetical protein [Verrucomicrobiota bacterium]